MRDGDACHADPLKLMEMKVKRHLKLLVCLWPGREVLGALDPAAEGCHQDSPLDIQPHGKNKD